MTEAAKTKTTTKKPAPKAEAPKPAPKVEAKDRPAPAEVNGLIDNIFMYGFLATLAGVFVYAIYALLN